MWALGCVVRMFLSRPNWHQSNSHDGGLSLVGCVELQHERLLLRAVEHVDASHHGSAIARHRIMMNVTQYQYQLTRFCQQTIQQGVHKAH